MIFTHTNIFTWVNFGSSLPNYNINQRKTISDKRYINKITKGVYELGSIFKTFTIALALEHKLVEVSTIIENIPKKMKCSILFLF